MKTEITFEQFQELIAKGDAGVSLTDEQKEIVRYGDDPLLVVAGAGSGKTSTMALRILHAVLCRNVSPERVLCLTFTRKAAAEIGKKVSEALCRVDKGNSPGIMAQTYNSFGQSLLTEFGILSGLDPDMRLVSEVESKQIITKIVEYANPPIPDEFSLKNLVDGAIKLSSNISNYLVDITILKDEVAKEIAALEWLSRDSNEDIKKLYKRMLELEHICHIVEKYATYKRKNGLIDYSDQDSYGAKLSANEHVQDALRNRYEMIILDEFQDTSVSQMFMLSNLFHDCAVTAVGDPLQAIYGFRGASADALNKFYEKFCRDSSATDNGTSDINNVSSNSYKHPLTLSVSWRNKESILNIANRLIEIWNPIDSAQVDQANGTDPSGGGVRPVKLITAEAQKRRHDEENSREPKTLEARKTPDAAINALIKSEQLLHDEYPGRVLVGIVAGEATVSTMTAEIMKDAYDVEKTMAILVRKRDEIDPLIQELRGRGIACAPCGLDDLLKEPAVADIVAVLESVAYPQRNQAILRLLIAQDIGPSDLQILQRYAREQAKKLLSSNSDNTMQVCLRDAIAAPPPALHYGFSEAAHLRIQELNERLNHVERYAHEPLTDLVKRIIQTFDIDIDIKVREDADSQVACMETFLEEVSNFMCAQRGGLIEFVETLDIIRDDTRGIKQPEAKSRKGLVQVMTIHQSKGLEWDIVACPSMSKGGLPGIPDSTVAWDGKSGGLPVTLRSDRKTSDEHEIKTFSYYLNLCARGVDISADSGIITGKNSKEDKDYKKEIVKELIADRNAYIDWEKAEEILGYRRLAYVACTRARELLIVVGEEKDSKKKDVDPELSPFMEEILEIMPVCGEVIDLREHLSDDVLDDSYSRYCTIKKEEGSPWPIVKSRTRAALSDAKNRVLELMQNDQIEIVSPTDSTVSQWLNIHLEAADMLLKARDEAEVIAEVAIPQAMATTSIERLLKDPKAFAYDLKRPIPQRPWIGAGFGQQFHKIMQEYLASGRKPDLITGSDKQNTNNAIVVDERFQEGLSKALDSVEKLGLLNKYQVVSIESTIVSPGTPRLIARLDALLKDDAGKLCVVDWKTGAMMEHYRDQVLIYRAVVAQAYAVPVADVKAIIVLANAEDKQMIEVSASDPDGKYDVAYWRNRLKRAIDSTKEN